jgi:hypothetical protein
VPPEKLEVIQALLLFDPDTSREIGPALWASLLETEKFYNFGTQRATFLRYYISPVVPSHSPIGIAVRGLVRQLGGVESDNASDLIRPEERRVTKLAGREVLARTSPREFLASTARNFIPPIAEHQVLVVITDQEITPPAGYRYCVWKMEGADNVISARPTDPSYWRDPDPNRLATIKHRARAASVAVTGRLLHLSTCENPHCFLFRDVSSVVTLDYMTELGPEHDLGDLAGMGFDLPEGGDPNLVQKVIPTGSSSSSTR